MDSAEAAASRIILVDHERLEAKILCERQLDGLWPERYQAAERLRQLEDPVPEYRVNRLNIWFNSFASFEATDKILTAYTAGLPQAAYNNYAEDKRAAIREETVRPLMIFGSIFLMT